MPDREDPRFGGKSNPVRRAIRRLSRTVPVERVPLLRGQAIAVAGVLGATLLRLTLEPMVSGVPYITFFPAVLIVSIWGGTRAGLTALVLSWGIASYLWLDPPGSPSFDRNAIWTAVAFAVFAGVLVGVAAMLRDLVVELRRSEEHSKMLAGEMEHRVENLMATATALARQTARSATSTDEHVRLFEARMATLGHARRLALSAPGGEADLRALLDGVLAPFEASRFDLAGPAARVPEGLATILGLALHELATNALKYGALSRSVGRIAVRWSHCDGRVELDWIESGGPPVAQPDRTGFGTRMIRTTLASHGAESDVCFAPDGIRCRIAFPEPAGAKPAAAAARPAPLLPADGACR